MKKSLWVVLVIVLVFVGFYFYSSKSTYQQPSQQMQSQTTEQIQAQPSSQQPSGSSVMISGFAFNPGTLTVKAGTTVVWTNQDSAAHTVTSDIAGGFDSGNLVKGKTFQFTFATPGTYSYHCSIHASMRGTIIVQ